ncbi:MAG: hypothetical protein ACFFB2_07285 [Promethearchaeota archaeon]
MEKTSSDILVIHQNKVVFSSGQGPLIKHSKISATVTQVLTLFSERIMKGEQIHFIRFENHRMIFLFSQNVKDDKLASIVLIPIDRSPRQVIPAMSIILRMLEESLKGKFDEARNNHLDCFYQILSSPEKALFVVPRSPDGILAALVILAAFAHDMRLGIQEIVENIHFVDPSNTLLLQKIVQQSINTRILSFISLPNAEENENLLLFGLSSPQRQYFSSYPNERIYDVISRVFGLSSPQRQSNATKMRNLIANDDAREIAQSISLLPHSEDNFIRKEILLSTVLQPGKDIVVTLSTPVMRKLRELSLAPNAKKATSPRKIPTLVESPISKAPVEQLKVTTPEISEKIRPQPHQPKVEIEPTYELVAEPDAIPKETPGVTPEEVHRVIPQPIEPVSIPYADSEVIARLDKVRVSGLEYTFDTVPLILDTSPYEINLPETQNLPFQESTITLRLFQGVENQFAIHIYTFQERLSAVRNSLEDLSIKIGGETHLRENHVLLVGPIENQRMVLRALLWLSIVEYLTQVKMKLLNPSNLFNIPNEGSILIIPPKRDYIKEKIPSKFRYFIEEKNIRTRFEQKELWTLGRSQNELLSHLMTPLKEGNGVVFVASDENQEMEEIALFLLYVSDICGIGFSRW